MKAFKYIIICLLIAPMAWSQMPHSFKYQGLARDQNHDPIVEQTIGFRLSIIQGSQDGAMVYQESHEPETGPTGLFSLSVGQGRTLAGVFEDIDWATGPHYMDIELDLDNSGTFRYAGTTPLEAVPFAMYAKTAENVDDADADPHNELQTLSFDADNNTIKISGGNEISLPAPAIADADADPTNELQTITKEGNVIKLSNGGTVEDNVDDADADPANELQTISYNAQTNKLKISSGNEIKLSLADADADPKNELQSLRIYEVNDPLEPLRLDISQGNYVRIPLTTPWGVHKDNGKITAMSTQLPVRMRELRLNNIEVYDHPSQWPYPQISKKEYAFKTGNGRTGMRMSKDHVAYYRQDQADDFLMQLSHTGLRYYDGAHFVASEIGGTHTGGFLRLYPGLSTKAYFKVETNRTGRSELQLIGAKNKGFMFRAGESAYGWGYGYWSGHNGSHNVTIGAGGNTGNGPNSGSILVHDKSSVARAGAYINAKGQGVLFADVKNFRVDHPNDSEKQIVYASLEGPEAAIYLRGTSAMEGGTATVEFPEHFQLMLHEEHMTVLITPLSAESKGVAVVSKSREGFEVRELLNGKGNYSFDWEVKGVRLGYEDLQVVQDKVKLSE